ncbi:hypothetical protein CJU89_3358 [Yarrowia sp. B02]|nr:hypothetical protein CJU89_3358 [Yarrowia sp. B02]
MDTKRSLSGAPSSPRKWTQKRVKTDSLLEDSRLFRPTSPLKWHRKKGVVRPKISAPLEAASTKFYTPAGSPRTEAGGFAYNVELPHSFTFNHSSIFHEHLSDSDKSHEDKERAFNVSVDSFSKSMEMLKQTGTASSSRLNLSLAPLALSSVPPLDIPHEMMQHHHESPSEDEFHDTRTSFRHSLASLHGLTDINNEINDINAQINDINQQIRGIAEVDKIDTVSAVAPVEHMVTAKMESGPENVDTENILAELSSLEHEEDENEEEKQTEAQRENSAAGEEEDSLRPLEYDLGSGPKSSMPRFPTSSTLGTLVDDSDKAKTGGAATASVASPRSFATSASARTLFADRFIDPESIRDSIRVVDISVRDDDEEEEQEEEPTEQPEISNEDSSALNSSSVIASTPLELSHTNLPTNLFRTHQDRSKYTENGVLDNRVSLISTGDKYPMDIDNLSPVRGADEPSFSLRDVPIETSHRDDYVFEQMKEEEEEGDFRPVSSVSTHSSSLAGTASSTDSLGINFAPPDLLSQPLGFKMVSNDMGGCSSSEDSAAHNNEATERGIPLTNFANSSFAELNSGDYQFPDIEVDEPQEPQASQVAPDTPLSVHSQQFSYPPSLSYSPASMEEPIMHPPRAHVPFVFRSRELDEKDQGLYAQNNTVFVNNAFIPFYPSPENSPQFPNINSFPEVRGVSTKEPPKEYLELKAERDKEIARLTREFEERDRELLAQAGKDTSPDIFNIPATPAPLRVRKQRQDRPKSERPLSEVPQIPKRSASRRSSKRSSLIPSSETHHSDMDAIQPLPVIDASTMEPEVEEKQGDVLSPSASQRQASAGSTGTVIRHPLQNQFPSLPDNEMLFMTRTGQKQNFGKIQPLKSNPGGTHLYDLEAQRENNMCRDSISLLMLFLFIFMPPLWLAMGFGYLDTIAGEVKPTHKKVALALGGTMVVAVVVGISVGLGVGLTR